MIEQILSFEQMQHLKSIGYDVNPNGMSLIYTCDGEDDYYLKYGESTCDDDVAAFGLQDIINYLPTRIKRKNYSEPYNLELSVYAGVIDYMYNRYIFKRTSYNQNNDKDGILNASYEMLLFLFENKIEWEVYRRFEI